MAVVIIAVLVGILIPQLRGTRTKAVSISCPNHLRQVALAFRNYSTDNGDRFPTELLTQGATLPPPAARPAFFFGQMSNELGTPRALVCPLDTRSGATNFQSLLPTNVSYFVGLDAVKRWPQSMLAGDRNLTTDGVPVGPGLLAITPNTTALGWSVGMHRHAGNVALADGRVQQSTGASLKEQARRQGLGTNCLAIP